MGFNILVVTSDQSAGINFSKSLQLGKTSPDEFTIIGTSSHPGRALLTTNDYTVLIPNELEKVPVQIKKYVESKLGLKIDLFYETRSAEPMLRASRQRSLLPTFLPAAEAVEIFEDKFKTFNHLEQANLPVPKTRLLNSPSDVPVAMRNIGAKQFWVRATVGYAGAGAFPTKNAQEAISAIEKENGWGRYSISERLPSDADLTWEERLSDKIHPGEMVNWMALYHEGELIACQSRKRLYFEHQNLTKGGVSHTGGIMTLQNQSVCELADNIVRSFDYVPHGPIGIDFMADDNGNLKLTEIQSCRFFTTTYFLSMAGLNFPKMFVDAYRGNVPHLEVRADPIPAGLVWLQRFGSDDTLKHRDEILGLIKNGIMKNDSSSIHHQNITDSTASQIRQNHPTWSP